MRVAQCEVAQRDKQCQWWQQQQECQHHRNHDQSCNQRFTRCNEPSRNGLVFLALGIQSPVTVIVDHGYRDLHGCMRRYHQYDYRPDWMLPRGEQGEEGDGDDMKHDRHGVTEQEKAQDYFIKSALFDDFHVAYTSIKLILSYMNES